MNFRILLLISLFILSQPTYSQNSYENWVQKQNIPPWVYKQFRANKLDKNYSYNFKMNPFYLRGDFNGDNLPDVAVAIENKNSHKKGVVIFHGDTPSYFILGAGKVTFKRKFDDFKSLTIWRVRSIKKVSKSSFENTEPPKLIGESIFFAKPESSSGIVYWTGSEYEWYQQGD